MMGMAVMPVRTVMAVMGWWQFEPADSTQLFNPVHPVCPLFPNPLGVTKVTG